MKMKSLALLRMAVIIWSCSPLLGVRDREVAELAKARELAQAGRAGDRRRVDLELVAQALALDRALEPLDRGVLGLRVALGVSGAGGRDLATGRRRPGRRAQVGRLLGLAGRVRAQRRARGRRRRVDAGDGLAGDQELARVLRVDVVAAGQQDAEPLAVGVARTALAGQARQGLDGLLVDRAVRRERAVLDLVVAPGQDHVVLAVGGQADLLVERDGLVVELGQRRDRRAQVARQAAQLPGLDELTQL